MLSRACGIALGLLVVALPLAAQPGRKVPVPREIAAELSSRHRKEPVLATPEGMTGFLEARAVDLNADGQPEYVLSGLGPLCGANNCTHWVFRRTPEGRYEELLETAGRVPDVLETTRRRYRDLRTSSHLSSAESVHTLYQFDGRRYQDVGEELHLGGLGERVPFRITSPLPLLAQGRAVRLEERPISRDSDVRMSARHVTCRPGRETPGKLCGDVLLFLSEPRGAGLLPQPGPGCFRLQVDPAPEPAEPLALRCEAASAAEGGAGRRALALRLTPGQWRALGHAYEARLVSPRGTLVIDDFRRHGLSSFIDRVFTLNGMKLYDEGDVAEEDAGS